MLTRRSVLQWALLPGFADLGRALAQGEAAQLPRDVTVDAGSRPGEYPVSLPLPGLTRDPGQLRLVETTGGGRVPVPAQLEPGDPPRLWWIVSRREPPARTRRFALEKGPAAAATPVEALTRADALEVHRGKAPILRYNSAHVPPPRGLDARYGRSAFIHPVWTPAGAVVTDQFPPDHPHQDGVFLAFTKAEFEGHPLNFWDLLGGTGRVRFKSLLGTTSGPVFGGFRVEHEHVDLTVPGGKVVLRETWDVRVWNRADDRPSSWVWDLVSTIRCATSSPLKLPKYHYGGMAIRGARAWGKDHGQFRTAEGKGRVDGNHTRPRWCDLSGPVGAQQAGVALLTHPANFRYPEPLRLHPTMPYMVYTPSFLGDWEIKPGASHVARYRFFIHDGAVKVEEIEQVWRDFAEPVGVRTTGG